MWASRAPTNNAVVDYEKELKALVTKTGKLESKVQVDRMMLETGMKDGKKR